MRASSTKKYVYYQFLILGIFILLTLANEALDVSHWLFGDPPTVPLQRVGEMGIEIGVAILVVTAEISFVIRLRRDIRILEGFIPICANCKRIREMDRGAWQALEHYIEARSLAQFSHAICPDCVRSLYPELADEILKKLESPGSNEVA